MDTIAELEASIEEHKNELYGRGDEETFSYCEGLMDAYNIIMRELNGD